MVDTVREGERETVGVTLHEGESLLVEDVEAVTDRVADTESVALVVGVSVFVAE